MWLEKVAADLPIFVEVEIVTRWPVYCASTCIFRLTVAYLPGSVGGNTAE